MSTGSSRVNARGTTAILLFVITAVLTVLLIWRLAAPRLEPPQPLNVVFVLIDTLRADHVGAYGYARETTPHLDALAAESILFEDVITQAPWTQPSLASMFTSRYSIEYSADKGYVPLPDEAVTLTEIVQGSGYDTIGIFTNPHNHPTLGVMQGFDRYELELMAPADRVVDRALNALDELASSPDPSPFLLYLHFMDVHTPLRPPAAYETLFPTQDGLPHLKRHRAYLAPAAVRNDPEALQRFSSHSIALYDGSLRFVDDQIGRLIDELRGRNLLENTILLVISDHGEAQWENLALERRLRLRKVKQFEGVGHGSTLFPETLHVPWLMRIPGAEAMRVTQQVRGLDVAPTLLGALGLSSESLDPLGIDVLSAARAGELEDLPAISHTWGQDLPQTSLITRDLQIMQLRKETHLFEWHDLRPFDVTSERPDDHASLSIELEQSMAEIERGEGLPVIIPDEILSALTALGYAEPDEPESAKETGSGRDDVGIAPPTTPAR